MRHGAGSTELLRAQLSGMITMKESLEFNIEICEIECETV